MPPKRGVWCYNRVARYERAMRNSVWLARSQGLESVRRNGAFGISMPSWKVLIERGNLGFSAAHFITFGGECERLHGHNYGVRVEVTGPLTSDSYVLDFTLLKQVTRAICHEWDHRFLMPLRNPDLRVTQRDGSWEMEYTGAHLQGVDGPTGPARFVMPAWTVLPLPVDNVTAERLAELLAHRIIAELRRRGVGEHLTSITVGVEETEMQAAFCTLDLTHLANDHTDYPSTADTVPSTGLG